MDVLEYREYCLSLPYTEECTPFDETTLVFKVAGKMFAYADMDEFHWICMKCEPDKAIELREKYSDQILPAYHSNKRHWNMVRTDGDLPDRKIKEWIKDSYLLVVEKLPKMKRWAIMDELPDL